MNINDLIADSNIAQLNQENETALKLAKQAIRIDVKNAEAYRCAANACMSLERYEEAVHNYKIEGQVINSLGSVIEDRLPGIVGVTDGKGSWSHTWATQRTKSLRYQHKISLKTISKGMGVELVETARGDISKVPVGIGFEYIENVIDDYRTQGSE